MTTALFLIGFLLQIQTPMGNIPIMNTSNVTYQQVPIPTDQTSWCSAPANASLCGMVSDLVAANDPAVDAILTKWKVKVTDATGKVLFPRTAQ